VVVQAHDDGPNHVVQARAKPATGDDAGAHCGWVEEDALARAGQLERRRRLPGGHAAGGAEAGVDEHALAVVDEAQTTHRRVDAALAEPRDREIARGDLVVRGGAHATSTGTGTASQIFSA
jgi:hypothetical protein